MSIDGIVKALVAACLVAWGLFVEFRMHQVQSANELLKRELDDKNIEASVKSLSDSDLHNELNKDIS